MSGPTLINPEAFYSVDSLCDSLGLRPGSIDKARKSGELKSTSRGGVSLFLGLWVQQWLLQDSPPRRRSPRREAVTA